MRRTWLAAVLVAAMALGVAVAEEKQKGRSGYAKCKEDTQTCLNHMVSEMKGRGWLGIQMDTDGGPGEIKVTKVVAGSPAEAAGFQVGDVLVSVNGARFAENTEEKCVTCEKTKDSWKPGTRVSYVVKRAGTEATLSATLAALPSDVMAQMIGMHMMDHSTVDADVAKK